MACSRPRASRREFLKAAAGLSALAAGASTADAAQAPPLRPTPSCPGAAPPTERQTEGPYFKPDSPLRASLVEPGMAGTKIVVTGMVLSTSCQPIARALIDVWHADDRGGYDNAGYRLRGHQFTDDQGRYRLETIVPGIYPGRTRHFHVKVQAPNRPVLTTQLYFPGEAVNTRDPIFSRDLVMQVSDGAGGKAATFDFVLDLGSRQGKG
ncbi:MAG: intradiol ring-cleavage dioxygenase [Candidatus Rokuibacteriota bacterium]|nr:MAG: intradiol ring-cleavage dioxygenase [Candidatus Rokubacteria bacterium]PYO08717.1 MAG: intradiol ring-cleavage dioxygenase [Candidatus Rokubacteria bacterium]